MRFWRLVALIFAAALCGQTDPVETVISRLQIDQFKAHIKGIAQFGDRERGTDRNRAAVDWLDQQLRGLGYQNVTRQRYMSDSGLLENIYATKVGDTIPGEMYIASAHLDGRGGGEAADDDGSGCSFLLEMARVLAMPDVHTTRSVRFIFWNNEEFGMDGSGTYANERAPLQGTADEPKWLGVIQHDMMMYDHGMPPGPKQSPHADINVEYQASSKMAAASATLAAVFRDYANEYPVTIGNNMAGTDSIRFEDLVASVSIREAERIKGIVAGSNPHHHEASDKFENYSEDDFRFGFNALKTSFGAISQLAGVTLRLQ